MTTRASYILVFALVSACGGASGTPASKAEAPSHGTARDERGESIASAAAAQGGLAALGGAGNREGGATGTEIAMSGPLRAEPVDRASPVRLDGVLKEWPARSASGELQTGKTDGLGLAVAVQYDDASLYLAGEINDSALTRTRAHGESDDHVSMTIAFPAGRGALSAYAIGFWAGKPGESRGVVRWLAGPNKGQAVAGAKIVEADTKGGYVFEASLPWAAFAEARTMRVGLRAALRYHDGDGGGVIGSGPGTVDKPADLPALPTAAEQAVVDGLLGAKNLATTPPKIDVFADLVGDEQKERISVFGRFFTICGPGYRGGKQFFWREIDGDLAALETRDLTSHGKDDVIVRRRVTVGAATHELLEIWSLASSDEPVTVFTQEIAITSAGGSKRITNAVHLSAKEIEVTVEPAVGWEKASFNEPLSDGDGILLPWGTVKSRTYRWEKTKFARASEVTQAGAPGAAAAEPIDTPQAALPRDVPTPKVQKGADLGKQVLATYFRDQGLSGATKPRFDLEVHVDGDARPERVLLVGRDVVVLGPGFKDGTGYARMSLTQFADDKDIAEMTARDVTGDGAAEIVLRGTRHITTKAGERVDVEGLFIYQVRAGSVVRVLAIETGRELSGKRVQGLVQFVPARGGRGFDVDVRPGIAKGWSEKTYPWPEDRPGGSFEPLLLPWSKIKSLRYVWNGTQFSTP